MVTMATEAATDYELVRDLVQNGMDCMRINCAHDSPEVWLGMIRNLQKAREETGRNCHILMDVAGPKLRTGPIEPGPAVIKCRPKRDVYGRVVTPARIWLTPEDNPAPAPGSATAAFRFPPSFLKKLRPGDEIRLRDARKAGRTLRIASVAGSEAAGPRPTQTIYFVPASNCARSAADKIRGRGRKSAQSSHRRTSCACRRRCF